jgi:hypothetical protein
VTLPDAYFAGFFDGEGYLSIIERKEGLGNFRLRVGVTNSDTNVLVRFQERFGGRIAPQSDKGEGWKSVYDWLAPAGTEFLRSVLPYLVVKRERVEVALDFVMLFEGEHALRSGRRSEVGQRRVRTMWARRTCFERMRVLNRRGTIKA